MIFRRRIGNVSFQVAQSHGEPEQAILCCKDVVDSPFLVINADDYYGKQAYVEAYEYALQERQHQRMRSVWSALF